MMAAFFGVFYLSVMLSFIYQTRILPGGVFTVWLILSAHGGCDTCAYCVGMLIGRHKMAPILSPKKICRRRRWRYSRSSTHWRSVWTFGQSFRRRGGECYLLCCHRSRREGLSLRSGFSSLCDQEKAQH